MKNIYLPISILCAANPHTPWRSLGHCPFTSNLIMLYCLIFSFADNDFIDRIGYMHFLSAGSAANEDGRKNAASSTMVHLLCK